MLCGIAGILATLHRAQIIFLILTNPSHKFSSLDTFKVCLTSFNSQGCPDKVCKNIINDYKPYLFIPNVFTPQGRDTVNGRFDIVAFACQYYHLDIYNRWGEKVFEGFEDGEGNTDTRNWNGYTTPQASPAHRVCILLFLIMKLADGTDAGATMARLHFLENSRTLQPILQSHFVQYLF